MLGLATTNTRTKFVISTLMHYKKMKGDKKILKNLVVWGVRGHPRSRQPFDRAYTTSYLTLWKLYVDLVKDPRVLVSSWQCPGVAVIRAGGTGEGR